MYRIRNSIPAIYGLLIVAGFLVSVTVGIIVIIVGGTLTGMLWSALSRGGPPVGAGGRDRDRSTARAARRAGRR
ncbi:MAG: hypothetical protein M3071_24640 [Actinomycetota bacterium]|nr:hypothetical protein [Actinomycetota bacterium]